MVFWLLILVKTVTSFLWSVMAYGFKQWMLVILAFTLLAVVALAVEVVELSSEPRREKVATVTTSIFLICVVGWLIWQSVNLTTPLPV